jgi:hypothetical protein
MAKEEKSEKPKKQTKVEKLHEQSKKNFKPGTRKEMPGRKDRGEDFRRQKMPD